MNDKEKKDVLESNRKRIFYFCIGWNAIVFIFCAYLFFSLDCKTFRFFWFLVFMSTIGGLLYWDAVAAAYLCRRFISKYFIVNIFLSLLSNIIAAAIGYLIGLFIIHVVTPIFEALNPYPPYTD